MKRLWARWQFTVRRVGRWTVWLLLVLTLFRLGVIGGRTRAHQDLTKIQSAPPASATPTEQEAMAFAAAFAAEYLSYAAGDQAARAQRLAPFLAPGLDANAGLLTATLRGTQAVAAVWPWQIEKVADARLRVTVVAAVSSNPGGTEAQSVRRFLALTVPVATVGPGRHVVYDLPAFRPWTPRAEGPGPTYPTAEVPDPDQAIQGVLRGFFRAYTGGTSGELAVFMHGDAPPAFDGQVQFRQLIAYRLVQNGDGLLALADVEMQDPLTQAIYRQRYTLGLVERAGRWLVQSLNPSVEGSVTPDDQAS